MRLKRGLKRTLLFVLAFLVDEYTNFSIRNYYRYFYQPGGGEYKRRSLVTFLNQASRFNQITKKVINGEVYLFLGTKGEKFLDELIPLIKFEEKKWDKIWRILIFDIPEKSRLVRDQLRKKIKDLGFARWQKSVYVTPHPITKEINEYLINKNLYPRCVCFEAKKLGEEDDRELAYRIFRLKKIDEKYRSILKKINYLKKNSRKITKSDLKKEIKDLVGEFEQTILKDPFLPKELLPKDWKRKEAKEELKKLLKFSFQL
ncbi:MAG: CRISPR-associated endonuclease Cas2 [Microgenomates group bacterium]